MWETVVKFAYGRLTMTHISNLKKGPSMGYKKDFTHSNRGKENKPDDSRWLDQHLERQRNY